MEESKNVKSSKTRYHDFFAKNHVPMQFMQKIVILITTKHGNFSHIFAYKLREIKIFYSIFAIFILELYAKNAICDYLKWQFYAIFTAI